MLDLRATKGTPGATTTIANLATIPVGDGSVVAGVPLSPAATLVLWGSSSLIANTICSTRMISQDCIDPINGELITTGTTSLQNLFYKFTRIKYSTGSRNVGQGTNTAQTATSLGYTLDHYDGIGTAIAGARCSPNVIAIPQTLAADVAVAWVATGLAPATQIPNGRYALLGAYLSTSTEAHGLRFVHADFGFCRPGFPLIDSFEDAIHGFQKSMKDELATSPGYQFVALSELIGRPCVPVFTVSNAGTGLQIESISAAATDTPIVTVNLAKVG